jgi:DNA-binding CsgD family transcriptional regulator
MTDPKGRRRRTPSPDLRTDAPADASDSELRQSGIRLIGALPWGAHICAFYETKQDLLDTAASYFQAGLESNEFCVWAVSEPVTVDEAKEFLLRNLKDFDRHLDEGRFEILPGHDWYLSGGEVDLKRITKGWNEKLEQARSNGQEGMRVSGNAFWMASHHWKEFCEYEHELDSSLAGQNMLVLCTYSLRGARAIDLMDVARAHQVTIARRGGEWEFLETPELKQANQELRRLRHSIDILIKPFAGHELLTPRERVVLAQIVGGASNKEVAVALGVSPRTVEFHRANILQKLDARNTADLVRKVLGQ